MKIYNRYNKMVDSDQRIVLDIIKGHKEIHYSQIIELARQKGIRPNRTGRAIDKMLHKEIALSEKTGFYKVVNNG